MTMAPYRRLGRWVIPAAVVVATATTLGPVGSVITAGRHVATSGHAATAASVTAASSGPASSTVHPDDTGWG
jgi:hypothetical protein